MISIIETCRRFEWPVTFLSVISDRPCEAIAKARNLSIPAEVVNREKLGKTFQMELLNKINHHNPDLIALAGFMVILDANLFSELFDSMINIHPSLLPMFKGLNTHQRVLNKLKIDLNLRPQNLNFETYYKLTREYEDLNS